MVTLAVKDADRAAGLVNVGGLEVQRLLDAEAGPVEHGQQGAIADAGRGAAGARGEQRAHLGLGEDLGGALAHRVGHLSASSVVNPSNRHC
jgi:hypothetical protein